MLGALGFTLILASLLLAYLSGESAEIEKHPDWDPIAWEAAHTRHPSGR